MNIPVVSRYLSSRSQSPSQSPSQDPRSGRRPHRCLRPSTVAPPAALGAVVAVTALATGAVSLSGPGGDTAVDPNAAQLVEPALADYVELRTMDQASRGGTRSAPSSVPTSLTSAATKAAAASKQATSTTKSTATTKAAATTKATATKKATATTNAAATKKAATKKAATTKAATKKATATKKSTKVSGTSPSAAKTTAKTMVAKRGWSSKQYTCLVSLWERESNWNHRATNPSSGAYGIPQSLPASKMASAGSDWRTNPATQIAWGLDYIADRHSSPCGALSHSHAKGWY